MCLRPFPKIVRWKEGLDAPLLEEVILRGVYLVEFERLTANTNSIFSEEVEQFVMLNEVDRLLA